MVEIVVVNHAFLGELCVSKKNPFAFNRAYVVETFEGENFANFVVLWLFVKVFFINLGAWHYLASNPRKFSL